VLPYTLIYPEKRFLLTHAGRTLLYLRPAPAQIDRVAAALNVPMKDFIETDQEFVEEKIRVRMILGNINAQRPRRDLQFIFINDRPIESKNLSFNLNDVYKLILPPGVYGTFLVNIRLDPANVDVNIHPTKREVRLKDEARIISILRRMTEYQLMQKGHAKTFSTAQLPSNMSFPDANRGRSPIFDELTNNRAASPISTDDTMREFQLFGEENNLRSKYTRSRFVGSFLQKFLIFEVDESLLIVDQHAAQERIMFEKFKDQIENAKVESQPLLTPILLKLTPQEKVAWEELQEELTTAGIETTQFDDDTIALQTQPLLLKNISAVVRDLLAGPANGGAIGQAQRMDHATLARRACKASVVAGDRLDASQADYQRKQLLECKDPFTCPHGRPTLIEVTQGFLDRQFLRT
jgi:DNA mismatch repair protein MutL